MNNKSAGVFAFLSALFFPLTIAPGLYMILSMENVVNGKET